MPRTDTRDLAQALVSLTLELLCVPTRRHTFESLSLGDADHINHVITVEHLLDWNGLFHVFTSPGNLLGHRSTVHLDLHDMRLLLPTVHQLHLGMSQDTYDSAVSLQLAEVLLNLLLARLILPLEG